MSDRCGWCHMPRADATTDNGTPIHAECLPVARAVYERAQRSRIPRRVVAEIPDVRVPVLASEVGGTMHDCVTTLERGFRYAPWGRKTPRGRDAAIERTRHDGNAANERNQRADERERGS